MQASSSKWLSKTTKFSVKLCCPSCAYATRGAQFRNSVAEFTGSANYVVWCKKILPLFPVLIIVLVDKCYTRSETRVDIVHLYSYLLSWLPIVIALCLKLGVISLRPANIYCAARVTSVTNNSYTSYQKKHF